MNEIATDSQIIFSNLFLGQFYEISNMRHCEGGANALWAFEPGRVYATEAISLIKEKIASFLAMTD